MMAPITVVSPSEMQSTSTSVASSRKRSTSTGRSGEASTALLHVVGEFVVAIDDLHGAAAEHEAGAHEAGVADARGDGDGFVLERAAVPLGAWFNSRSSSSLAKNFRSSASSMFFGEVPMMWHAVFFEALAARFSGVWPPNCTMTPQHLVVAVLALVDVQHVLERERLEVEAVAGVVVGGDGLGIRVDHDGLEAQFAQREAGMDAAVVELNALPDAVGAAAEDHDFPAVVVGASRSRRRRWSSSRACRPRTPPRRCPRGGRWG